MTGDDVGIGQAFTALWPILLALGGGYVTLLGIIYKLMQNQIDDLKHEKERLMTAIEGLKSPLDKVAETAQDQSQTLQQMLDDLYPRTRPRRNP